MHLSQRTEPRGLRPSNRSPPLLTGDSQNGPPLADGEVSTALKEAAALAVSVAKRCDGCIAYHAKGAARAGATPGQVADLLGVALLMDGGTASVYAPRAWAAFNEFREELTSANTAS